MQIILNAKTKTASKKWEKEVKEKRNEMKILHSYSQFNCTVPWKILSFHFLLFSFGFVAAIVSKSGNKFMEKITLIQ